MPNPRSLLPGILLLCAAAVTACEPVDVPASALHVSVSVSPRTVSKASADSGRVTIRVRARNPRLTPVRVDVGQGLRFGQGAARSHGMGFGWEIQPAAPGGPHGLNGGTWGRRYYEIPPLSSVSYEVVVLVNVPRQPGLPRPRPDDSVTEDLPPARYRVLGSFGTHESSLLELAVTAD